MAKSTSWSVISLVFVCAGAMNMGACGSDDDPVAGPVDSGSDRSSGGRGGSSGSSGAGGTGDASDAGTCTTAVAVVCDGPEDCPTGQRCCGRWEQEYTEFGCYASCLAQQGDATAGPGGGALWFDLCHPGDTCEDSVAECLTSPYLPDSLSRCYDTGDPPDPSLGRGANQVNCGDDVCGTGEKCCLRGTLEPYCAPASATCSCTAPTPDAGSDAAPDSGDAAPGDAAPDSGGDAAPGDAASDAPTG